MRFNLLEDERDRERLVEALKPGLELLATPAAKAVTHEVFLAPGGQANTLNRPSAANWCKSAAILALFDVAPLRRWALRQRLIDPGRVAADGAELQRIVEAAAAPVHHVCGTVRMGAAADPLAALDPECRVRGLEGLRVVDASAMPSIVSANTHLTMLMMAEKVAAVVTQTAST